MVWQMPMMTFAISHGRLDAGGPTHSHAIDNECIPDPLRVRAVDDLIATGASQSDYELTFISRLGIACRLVNAWEAASCQPRAHCEPLSKGTKLANIFSKFGAFLRKTKKNASH